MLKQTYDKHNYHLYNLQNSAFSPFVVTILAFNCDPDREKIFHYFANNCLFKDKETKDKGGLLKVIPPPPIKSWGHKYPRLET